MCLKIVILQLHGTPNPIQSNPLNGSALLPIKIWTNKRIEPLSDSGLPREHYMMGLSIVSNIWAINQIEPLSGCPLSGWGVRDVCCVYCLSLSNLSICILLGILTILHWMSLSDHTECIDFNPIHSVWVIWDSLYGTLDKFGHGTWDNINMVKKN